MANIHLDKTKAEVVGSSADLFAEALRQALTYDIKSGLDKHFWLDVAEQLGQELAQDFYHAAVFCTRVMK